MSEIAEAMIWTAVVLLYWPAVVLLVAITGPHSDSERREIRTLPTTDQDERN